MGARGAQAAGARGGGRVGGRGGDDTGVVRTDGASRVRSASYVSSSSRSEGVSGSVPIGLRGRDDSFEDSDDGGGNGW